MPLGELVFRLGDSGTELNTDPTTPFVDITRVHGLDNAPIRETERDHEGVDGGFLDAEFETGRTLVMDGKVYATQETLESYLDLLKAEWAPSRELVPFYFRSPGQSERLLFVKPRGLRYEWNDERRIGCARVQFVMYAEDPRIYDAALSSVVISYGGASSNGFAFGGLLDTFSRGVVDGLGTSDSGHTYTLTGTAADFDVSNPFMQITLNAATGSIYFATPNVANAIDQYMRVQGHGISVLPTGGGISAYYDLRVVDANNYYRCVVTRTTADTTTVSLVSVVGGVVTTIAGPTAVAGATATSSVLVSFQVTQGQGSPGVSAIRAKVWVTGTVEPATWTVEAFNGGVTATGGMRIGAVRDAGNTNVAPTMTWGDLQWWRGFGFNLDFGGGLVPSSGVMTNDGNRPTPAVLTIQGPITNPVIDNETIGAELDFVIDLGASDTLVIDLAGKTVLLNGVTNRRGALIAPSWFLLDPGQNFIRFGGTSAGAPTLTIQFRSAWR